MTSPANVASALGAFPTVVRNLLEPLDPATLIVRPEPGEWSVHEVIGHLIATDTGAFEDRIQGILDGEPEIPGFSPWAAINERDFNAVALPDLLAEFDASRVRAAAYVASLDAQRLTLTGEYPGFGTFAAADFVYEWPFHDHEHLRQILDITKAVYLPSMSETMRAALQDSND